MLLSAAITPPADVAGRRSRELTLAVPAFAALFVVAALLGRATALEGRSLSLVWPAAGVAVVWFLTLTRVTAIVVSALLVTAATIVVNLLTRSSPAADLVTVFVAASLLQVAAIVVLVHRWCPGLGRRGGRAPLETPDSLTRFLAAAALGCLAGVVIGTAGLLLVGESVSALSALTWWGRNVCGVLAVGTTGLLLMHRLTRGGPPAEPDTDGGPVEALGLLATTVALVGIDYASGPPFTFLLPATTVWAAMRFSPLLVSSHALLGGGAVIWLTLTDHGLFAGSASPRSSLLLAQMFVGMTIMIGLFLAAGRHESDRLHARLDDRQRELEAFARRAAHDLQQPLMVIDGWADLLAAQLAENSGDLGPSDRKVDMVHRIQGATAEMRGLVSNLLADATARDRQVSLQPVDLARLARDIAEARGVTDEVHVGEIPTVLGDEELLRGLLGNLIGNALKYVEPGQRPQIDVTAHPQLDAMVSVSVADRGIGIPAGSHEAIFDEFTRVHGNAYPGTGLGLSISRRIVERHGGDISARARGSGPGTVFEFSLPMWQPTETPSRRVRRSPAFASSERHGS